jgi:formate hydrogenlyase transcriptional activator
MACEGHFAFDDELRHGEALVQLADLMVRYHDMGELFRALTKKLHEITLFDMAGVCLHDPARNMMSLRRWGGDRFDTAPIEIPMEDTTAGWVWANQQPLTFPDVQRESRFSTCLNTVREMGMHSFCELPLTTSQQRFGTMSLGSLQINLYGKKELLLLQNVAQMVALSLEHLVSHSALQQEKERMQALLEINAALLSSLDIKEMFPAIAGALRHLIKGEFATIALYDEPTQSLSLYALDDTVGAVPPGLILPLRGNCHRTGAHRP